MIREIILAGGCFWGVQHYLSMLPGVTATEVGYAESNVPHPTYESVCTGLTNATEAVHVRYNDREIALSFLLEMFYLIVDPTSVNRQGNDTGTQYRSGIYYTDSTDLPIIDKSIRMLQSKYRKPLAIEVSQSHSFYSAEEYHQEYLGKNPGGYCHVRPEMFSKAKSAQCPPSLIREDDKLREK